MDKVKTIALVPVLDGIPQLPIFVGTEEDAEQYWEDNPLNFLNRRVDTWEVCPFCETAYPELPDAAFGKLVCQKCSDDITSGLRELQIKAEAEAAWRVVPCSNCGQPTSDDGRWCDDCSDMVTGDIDEPEPCPISGDPCSIGPSACTHCSVYHECLSSDIGTCVSCGRDDTELTKLLCDSCYHTTYPSVADDELPF